MGIEDTVISIGARIFGAIWRWVKLLWSNKIRRIWIIKKLTKLADEKYEIEKDKLDKEVLIKEADLKEKAGLPHLRWSSSLARELLELNLAAAKKKIETRLKLDKKIIFSGKNIKSRKDVDFLYKRLKMVVDVEGQALNQKIEVIYNDCHANNFIDVDKPKIGQEIGTLLKEKYTDLMIEKETPQKD